MTLSLATYNLSAFAMCLANTVNDPKFAYALQAMVISLAVRIADTIDIVDFAIGVWTETVVT